MPVTFTPVSSPVGELVLVATDSGITGVYFPTSRHGPAPLERQDWVEDDGRSPASALLAIPYGTTLSYSELARRLGDLRATRAVGAANGRNPIPIIVPCHRVVGANGALTGFGGGLDCKRWLLEHEGALTRAIFS